MARHMEDGELAFFIKFIEPKRGYICQSNMFVFLLDYQDTLKDID